MATSGTSTFNLDIDEIIEEAFERAGLGRAFSGSDFRTARRSLNLLSQEFANRGINLWTVEDATQALTSGTATLETALFKVPQLVCYRSSYLNYWIAKRILKIKYISLVNLILDNEAVLELIQGECNSKRLVKELKNLINSKDKTQQERYKILFSILGSGGAIEKTADLIYKATIN